MAIREIQRAACFAILLICVVLPAFSQTQLILTNKINIRRTDELIVIKHREVQHLLSAAKPFLKVSGSGIDLVVQYDDLDQDGVWDEAALLVTFAPLQHLALKLSASPTQTPAPVTRAHVRQRRKRADNSFGPNLSTDAIPGNQAATDFSKQKLPLFLTEGPAWENDRVGFRLYFDVRNGKDIWGKTTQEMVMDTVGVNPEVIYHNRAPWGMDILKVGASLSAGALALQFRNPRGQDTLIRLGGEHMGEVFYQKLADGPLRAIFRLSYPKWHLSDAYPDASITEEISIAGGQYFYQSHITMRNTPADAFLVAGFADLYHVPSGQLKTDASQAFYSFGQQSENKDALGLALITSLKDLAFSGKVPLSSTDIRDSYMIGLRPSKTSPNATFKFYAAWGASDSRFKTLDTFTEFMTAQLRINDSAITKRFR